MRAGKVAVFIAVAAALFGGACASDPRGAGEESAARGTAVVSSTNGNGGVTGSATNGGTNGPAGAAPDSTPGEPARGSDSSIASEQVASEEVAAEEIAHTPAPVAETRSLASTIDGAIDWLIKNQNKDGSWGTHESPRWYEVLASVPGSHEAFRVATSALCVMALRDARANGAGSTAANADLDSAIDKGIDFLLAHYNVKRANGMEHYNVWSFGYTLQSLAEWVVANPADPRAGEARSVCAKLVDKLRIYQTTDGGWGYLSLNGVATFKPSDTSMSFTTATILIGIDRARAAGIEIPAQLLKLAVDHVARSRTPAGSFLYGQYLQYRPRHGINQIKGAACRTPLCHYTLELFGRKYPEAEKLNGLNALLIDHARFQRAGVRRPVPHESWYSISGYFYLYGHAYAAYLIQTLTPDQQQRYWSKLVEGVLFCWQPDGSFWDYPLYSYHKAYGTAFALIALSRVPPALRAEKFPVLRRM